MKEKSQNDGFNLKKKVLKKIRVNFKHTLYVGVIIFALTLTVSSCKPSTLPDSAGDKDGVLLGIFQEGAQKDLTLISENEKSLKKKFASIMWYLDWSTDFPMADAKRVSNAGYMPHITWEPWFFENKEKVTLPSILAGQWDAYITKWAKDAAKFGQPMFIRWGHEFNGDWYPWSMAKNGENGTKFIAAYRRIHDLFSKVGADNVKWIWCPNAGSVPNKPWNAALNGYPGDAYVDWIGIDGYNFSGSDSFKDIFARIYSKLVAEVNKPIMIGEFATGSNGTEKAQWLTEMAGDLKEFFPAVRAITYFDINKELDWRLITDAETAKAAQEALASDYFFSDKRLFAPIAKKYAEKYPTYVEKLASLGAKTGVAAINEISALTLPTTADVSTASALLASAPSIVLTSSDGEADLSGTIKFGWSANAFYFVADIKDDMPINNDKSEIDIWNGDCVEICISLDPKADAKREFFSATDFQLGFSPGKESAGIAPSVWAWASLAKKPDGCTVSVVKTATGYQLTGMIPWNSLVPGFAASAGMKLGLDFAFDDDDAEGNRESQTIWNGDASFYSNPTQWGRVNLN